MKKRSIAAASTVAILSAAVAPVVSYGQIAPLPAYDPMNYTSGSIAGKGAWQASISGGGHIQVDSTKNLSYPNLNPSTGGLATVSNDATGGEKLGITTVNGAGYSVYYSLTMRMTNMTNLIANTTTGTFFAGLNPDRTSNATGTGNAYLRVRRDPGDSTKWQFGIAKDTTTTGTNVLWQAPGTNYTVDPGTESNNPTFFLVARYINGNSASLWINPTTSVWGAPETGLDSALAPDLKPTTGADQTSVQDFFLRQLTAGAGNAGTPQGLQVDDVRVGTTWASVAPTVWKGTTSAYGTGSNWYTSAVPTDAAGVTPTFLDISTASRTVSLGSTRTLGGLIFNSSTGYTITGSGVSLVLDSPDASTRISSVLGNHTIATPVTLNKDLIADIQADSVTINNTLSGPTANLIKSGGGTLVLPVASTYGGNTTITGGALRAADGVGLPSTNLILTGGAFESTASTFTRALGTGANQVHLPAGTAGGFSASGTAVTVTLDGGNPLVWGNNASFSPNALILNQASASNTVTFTNDIDINGTNRTFTGNATGGNATAATLTGLISNGGATTNGIIKNGAGLLVLANSANSYNGQTQVLGGVLRGAYGTNVPNVSGSVTSILTLGGGVYEPTTSTFTQPLGNGTANGQVRLINSGASGFSAFGTPLTVNLGGAGGSVLWSNASTSTTTSFEPGTLVLNASTATASIEFVNPLNLGASPSAARVVAVNSAAFPATMSGDISGGSSSTGLTKTGVGLLNLRGSANSYVGTVAVSQGTLNINDSSQLGSFSSSASLVLSGGGTLQFGATLDLPNNRPIIIGAGGGTIDTNGNSTIAGYGGPGIGGGQTSVLTKLGGGTFYTGANNVVGAVGTLVAKGGTFRFFNEGQIFGGGTATQFTLDGGAISTPSSWNATAIHNITVTANNGSVGVESGQVVSWAGSITGPGVLTKADTGTFIVPNVRGPGLNVTGGKLAFTADGTANGVSVVNSTAVGSAQLDLSNNHIIDHTTGAGSWTGSNYTGVTGLVASGRNGNLWNGNGIITSQTQAIGSNYTSIGVAKASDVRPATATATDTWAGQTVTGTDTLVMYTYGGDATLDGKINIDDYVKIDSGIAAGLTGWSNGDFNYDGKVSIDDYITVIDANIGNQTGIFFTSGGVSDGLSGVAAVPEPTGVLLLTVPGLILSARRARRSRSSKALG